MTAIVVEFNTETLVSLTVTLYKDHEVKASDVSKGQSIRFFKRFKT